jgi:hypothetical protein
MGEIIGVLTSVSSTFEHLSLGWAGDALCSLFLQPVDTVRSLTESRRLLDEARREINESRERAQIRPRHTFSRVPGFFPRRAETQAIERALGGEPNFTVLFGASSVGKVRVSAIRVSSVFAGVLSLGYRLPCCARFYRKNHITFSTLICELPGSPISRVYIIV